jgi:hypothetical protein
VFEMAKLEKAAAVFKKLYTPQYSQQGRTISCTTANLPQKLSQYHSARTHRYLMTHTNTAFDVIKNPPPSPTQIPQDHKIPDFSSEFHLLCTFKLTFIVTYRSY